MHFTACNIKVQVGVDAISQTMALCITAYADIIRNVCVVRALNSVGFGACMMISVCACVSL